MRVFAFLSILFWAAGCVENPAGTSKPPAEKITLADLGPKAVENPTQVMLFGVANYAVDQANVALLKNCYERLPKGVIRFVDAKAFEENGFFAARGTGMQFGDLNACLMQLGAEHLGQTNLVLDADAEMPFSQTFIDREQTITSSASGGDSSTVSLHNGTLGWWLAARPNPGIPRQVHARILPVFTPHGLMNWPGTERYIKKMMRRFNEYRFNVTLREGDFVILGVKCDPDQELMPLQKLLFMHSDKSKMRLYIIFCVKARA